MYGNSFHILYNYFKIKDYECCLLDGKSQDGLTWYCTLWLGVMKCSSLSY